MASVVPELPSVTEVSVTEKVGSGWPSNAPMSSAAPAGRGAPRWSVVASVAPGVHGRGYALEGVGLGWAAVVAERGEERGGVGLVGGLVQPQEASPLRLLPSEVIVPLYSV